MELFHITNIRNLESIFNHGKILSKNKVDSLNQEYLSISYEKLQNRRSFKRVPYSPYGVLHDYVPFYFAPRSPMLCAIHHGRVRGYRGGQDGIIHLVTELPRILENRLKFVYTDGHPIMAITNFYNETERINNVIDWEVMNARYWSDTQDDPDRERRRQAEFLVYEDFPVSLLTKIAVISNRILNRINQVVGRFNFEIDYLIEREWYY